MPGKNTWNTEGGPPLSGQLVHEGRTVMVQQIGRTLHAMRWVFHDELGVSRPAAWMLTQLAHYDGLSQQQLAGITCVDRSMVTLLVKDMEVRYGWIRRERHAEDNRLVRVYLTKLGREHAAGLAKRIHVLDRHLTRGLTAPQLEQLRVMLQTLKANALKNLGGGGDSLDQEPEDQKYNDAIACQK